MYDVILIEDDTGDKRPLWHLGQSLKVGALLVAIIYLCLWLLDTRATGLLLDFREFSFYASHFENESEQSPAEYYFHQEISSDWDSVNSQILELELMRAPRVGDVVQAVNSYSLESSATYCLGTFLHYDRYPDGSQTAGETFDVEIRAGAKSTGRIPLSMGDTPVYLRLDNIKPIEDRLKVIFKLHSKANRNQSAWRRASAVSFKYAELWEC